MPPPDRYWLRPASHQFIDGDSTADWTEVTKNVFISAEHAEGFSAPAALAATAGFTGNWFDGTTLLTEQEAGLDLRTELSTTRENLHTATTKLAHLKRDIGKLLNDAS